MDDDMGSCPDCMGPVNVHARRCPNCGVKYRNVDKATWWIGMAIALLIVWRAVEYLV